MVRVCENESDFYITNIRGCLFEIRVFLKEHLSFTPEGGLPASKIEAINSRSR